MARNYYLILGVSSGASPEEIKQAYRQKALQFHPDHYGDDPGPFLEIQEAYAVLSDPVQRTRYDMQIAPRSAGMSLRGARAERMERMRRPVEPIEPLGPPFDVREVSLTESFQSFFPSFEEVFERLWSNFVETARPKSERPESLTVDVPLSREEALVGGQIRVMVPARCQCPRCGGYGGVGPYECWQCGGTGRATGEFPVDVRYPPGTRHGHTVTVPLRHLGIRNLYLTVRFGVC